MCTVLECIDTAISMYMPASVSVSYGADYVDTPIGVGTSELNKAGNVDLQSDAGRETIKSGLKNVGAAVKREGIDSLGKLDGLSGIREVAEMRDGVIFADRMELAFKGIGKRQFSFDFKMMPRSQAEADEIRDIIYAFKFNMMPEYVDGTRGSKMKVPNTFDIQYMYQNAENNYLNKISTCFLKDIIEYLAGAKRRRQGSRGPRALKHRVRGETSVPSACRSTAFANVTCRRAQKLVQCMTCEGRTLKLEMRRAVR